MIGYCFMNDKTVDEIMEPDKNRSEWNDLTHDEKNHQLYLRQKALLAEFLSKGAISQAQHDKSLHDLREKMGENGG